MTNTALETAWKRQAQWSDTANELKSRYVFWRRVVFGLAIIAAVSAALSVEIQSESLAKALAILAAICAGLSPIVSAQKVSKEQLQNWTRARSVSEELKSSIFKHLVSKNQDRQKLLNDAQEGAIANVLDIVPVAGIFDIPKRARLEDLTADEFIQHRVLNQVEKYYFPHAIENNDVAQRFHRSYLFLMLIAAAISALNGVSELQWLGHWTAVFTTLGASVLAYLAAGRYEYLSLSYQATGDQLINLRNRWEERPKSERENDAIVAKLVDDCEAVISNQNQSWHAKIAEVSKNPN